MPKTIPFYCNQYETFLGSNGIPKTLRCAKCRGVQKDIVAAGLSFINAYQIDHYTMEKNKRVFLQLDRGFQRMFVTLVEQTGAEVILAPDEEENPDVLCDKILKARKDLKDKYGSPEVQGFKDVLNADGMPLLSRQTKTLLMNLFMVLDNSEKEMLKDILQNPKQVESFLDSFQKQPQDNDLLKNVRALVYEYDQKRQIELTREQIRTMGRNNRRMALDRQRQLDIQRLKQLQQERQNIREHHR